MTFANCERLASGRCKTGTKQDSRDLKGELISLIQGTCASMTLTLMRARVGGERWGSGIDCPRRDCFIGGRYAVLSVS
jgi:hypothetical protein